MIGQDECIYATPRAFHEQIPIRFNKARLIKIAIQGTPQMAVDKEARAYRESTHNIITVIFPYFMCTPP